MKPRLPRQTQARNPKLLALSAALALSCASPAHRDETQAPPPTAALASASTSALPTPSAPGASSAPAPAASASAAEEQFQAPKPPDPPIVLKEGGKHAAKGDAGMVTSVEKNATHIGANVLRNGGNAIDAAVAVAYALAVTHPSAGNIGGGGLMLIRLKNGEAFVIDFRETAPKAGATTEKVVAMLDHDGGIGIRSTGVPGTVRGLALALEKFGTKPLAELLAPAIELAKKGHALGNRQAQTLAWSWPKLSKDPAARLIWGKGKNPLKEGDRVKQTDLAKTLETIAKEGPNAFYEGPIAKTIAEAMQKAGGYISAEDLASYQAKLRKPITFSYRGFLIQTAPPPSMGGIAFAQIMLTLERQNAHLAKPHSAEALHLFAEAAKRAYAERRLVATDPDFAPQTLDQTLQNLLSPKHLALRTPPIDPNHATPAATLTQAQGEPTESPETTHFSILDAEGNAVSCTYTLSASFGSKVIIPKTGILLGNALGGFSKEGLNTVAPGKRMATSMTPTIVTQNDKPVLILGSPGGDTIPNTVAQVLRNTVDWNMPLDEAILEGRIHHQCNPDKLRYENQRPPNKETLKSLKQKGHTLNPNNMSLGDANNILQNPHTHTSYGFADPREGGSAEGVKKGEGERESKGSRP